MKIRLNNILRKVRKLLSRIREISKEEGTLGVIRSGIRVIFIWLVSSFWCYYYKIFKLPRTFTFQGSTYNYFFHRYNTTWKHERTVEIPIIWNIVKKYQKKKILEVGNVLSHYFTINHDILDKYEKADNVINEDVTIFDTYKRYDLIVSISTLEHVGWDENPREPGKILHAIKNLKNLLVPGGKMIVTLPLGYNLEMDRFLRENKMEFNKRYYLKRISEDNKWTEVNWNDVLNVKYNYPFFNANGLVVGIIEKK